MTKTPWILIATVAMLVLGAALYFGLSALQKKEVLIIGLGGPMSGRFSELGLSMRQGVELAIKNINKNNELEKYELKLAIADDRSELNFSFEAEKGARALANTHNITAVVGHYFSMPSMAAGKIYKERQIPFVTPTSTLPELIAENDWGFSIMPDDYYQATFLANYILYGLERKEIALINSKDPYGRSLKKYFLGELNSKQLAPLITVEIDHTKFEPELLAKRIQSFAKADIIFVAMNYTTAAKVIQYLRKNGVNTDVVGAESLGGAHFIQEAGIYAENVYAVAPYLPSLFGESSKHYQMDFMREFQREPEWVSTYSYEATQLIAYAIRRAGKDPTAIRNFLRRIISEQEAMPSIAGPIYFNDWGASRRSLWMGQVKHGRYLPARFQLTHVKYQELAKTKQMEKEVITLGGDFMKRATVVYTGIYVNEIKSFNPVEGSFVADFNLWFRWDPGKNKNLDFEMTYGKVLTAQVREKYFDSLNNNNFISYSVSALMTDNFPLQEYPFDQQTLRIRIKPKKKTNEDLILVTDNDNDDFLRRSLDFGSWQDIDHLQFTSNKTFLWSYRNPKYERKLFELDHSQYNYHVIMQRKSSGYLIAMLPLLVLVSIAFVTFTMDYGVIASRLGVSMTTTLSAMAFHSGNKIGVGYLVKGDIFFLSSYVLFFCVVIETTIVNYLTTIDKKTLAVQIDQVAMIVYPTAVITILALLLR